jgi:NADH:ubiquinone oxidoreductase subunit 6 (subunit J)
MNCCYYWFLPFLVLAANCLYIGLSNHQIYIFLNFVSLLLLVVSSLLVLRVLCLSFLLALIYSGAVVIIFIFVVMIFDQSEILCIPSYKFIPVLVLYIEGFTL